MEQPINTDPMMADSSVAQLDGIESIDQLIYRANSLVGLPNESELAPLLTNMAFTRFGIDGLIRLGSNAILFDPQLVLVLSAEHVVDPNALFAAAMAVPGVNPTDLLIQWLELNEQIDPNQLPQIIHTYLQTVKGLRHDQLGTWAIANDDITMAVALLTVYPCNTPRELLLHFVTNSDNWMAIANIAITSPHVITPAMRERLAEEREDDIPQIKRMAELVYGANPQGITNHLDACCRLGNKAFAAELQSQAEKYAAHFTAKPDTEDYSLTALGADWPTGELTVDAKTLMMSKGWDRDQLQEAITTMSIEQRITAFDECGLTYYIDVDGDIEASHLHTIAKEIGIDQDRLVDGGSWHAADNLPNLGGLATYDAGTYWICDADGDRPELGVLGEWEEGDYVVVEEGNSFLRFRFSELDPAMDDTTNDVSAGPSDGPDGTDNVDYGDDVIGDGEGEDILDDVEAPTCPDHECLGDYCEEPGCEEVLIAEANDMQAANDLIDRINDGIEVPIDGSLGAVFTKAYNEMAATVGSHYDFLQHPEQADITLEELATAKKECFIETMLVLEENGIGVTNRTAVTAEMQRIIETGADVFLDEQGLVELAGAIVWLDEGTDDAAEEVDAGIVDHDATDAA